VIAVVDVLSVALILAYLSECLYQFHQKGKQYRQDNQSDHDSDSGQYHAQYAHFFSSSYA
jgi:hypothetical protein